MNKTEVAGDLGGKSKTALIAFWEFHWLEVANDKRHFYPVRGVARGFFSSNSSLLSVALCWRTVIAGQLSFRSFLPKWCSWRATTMRPFPPSLSLLPLQSLTMLCFNFLDSVACFAWSGLVSDASTWFLDASYSRLTSLLPIKKVKTHSYNKFLI